MKNFKSASIAAVCILATVAVTLSGCFKDDFDFDRMKEDMITWEPDIAFPIVYSILDAEEIISVSDSTNVYQYDSNNFITLIYRRRIFSETVNDFFQLPAAQQVNENISLSVSEIGQFSTSGTISTTTNSGMTIGISGPGGSQLNKVVYASGTMNISFTSNFEHSGFLEVSMPELRLNGTPFFQSYNFDYTGSPISVSINIPLAGYEMDLDNGNGPNTIPIDYTLNLNQGGGATPTGANQVQINHSFTDMIMAYADGDFGNFMLEISPSEVDLDVVQSEHGGNIYFEDPRFRLLMSNTIGADILVNVDQLYASGEQGQLNVNISSLIPGGQFTIPAAPAVGDSSTLNYYFTQNNSNIKDIINDQYGTLHHDFGAEVNPNGTAFNFAQRNSAVEVIAEIELPFWGYSDHFTIIDTVEVPFDEAADFADNIERGLLRINTVSHFPVDGLLKLYFADSAYNVIDSVLTDGSFIIRSGVVNADGKTVEATQTNNDIELDTAKINSLFDSRYLFIASDITSTDDAGRNIKLYTEDNIEIRIGLRVKLKASPSDINDF